MGRVGPHDQTGFAREGQVPLVNGQGDDPLSSIDTAGPAVTAPAGGPRNDPITRFHNAHEEPT